MSVWSEVTLFLIQNWSFCTNFVFLIQNILFLPTKLQHVFLSCFYIFIILRLLHIMSHIVTIMAIYHRDDSYEIICVTNSILKRKNLNVPRVVSWVNPLFDAALFSPVITNPQLSRWYLRPDYRIDFTFMTRR